MYLISYLRAFERLKNMKFVKVRIAYFEFEERIRHVVKGWPEWVDVPLNLPKATPHPPESQLRLLLQYMGGRNHGVRKVRQ